ncbi:MAG: class I SAM-dependent methyltransferase, partial [Chlamydiia bacterium]|nr:class I SAM-dependent methyltransferase [Chlamydiia bacterium]
MGNQSNLDLNADQYTKNSEIQLTLADKLLENYPIKKNAKILDIGCGDGRITSDLAHKAPNGKVIGLDASQNMIEYAQQHYPKNKCPNLEFVLEKAEELSITEKFDLIVSFNCFHWVRPWKEALKRFYDILNPKGEILFLTYPLENPFYKPFIEASKHFPEFIDQAAHTTMFSS